MHGKTAVLMAAVAWSGATAGADTPIGSSTRAAEPGTLAKGDFHVAIAGKDTNPGTAAAPFATLARARDAVRQKMAAGLTRTCSS